METSHHITTGNTQNITARIRSVLTVAGIVTAIICSLVLAKDAGVTESKETGVTTFVETSNFLNADLPGKIKNIAATSTMWLFR